MIAGESFKHDVLQEDAEQHKLNVFNSRGTSGFRSTTESDAKHCWQKEADGVDVHNSFILGRCTSPGTDTTSSVREAQGEM